MSLPRHSKVSLEPVRKIIRSDEGLTLETSAFESLYGGQFTFSTELIKPNYLVILPTDAAPQFVKKFAPFIQETVIVPSM